MKELNQRCKELKMTQDEWYAVSILVKMRKRKRMDNFEIQALRDVVKEGGEDVIDKFEKKFKEIRVEEKRKAVSSAMHSEKLRSTYYRDGIRSYVHGNGI